MDIHQFYRLFFRYFRKKRMLDFVRLLGVTNQDQKWTPLIGQRGSDLKVESGNIIMLPVRAV